MTMTVMVTMTVMQNNDDGDDDGDNDDGSDDDGDNDDEDGDDDRPGKKYPNLGIFPGRSVFMSFSSDFSNL